MKLLFVHAIALFAHSRVLQKSAPSDTLIDVAEARAVNRLP